MARQLNLLIGSLCILLGTYPASGQPDEVLSLIAQSEQIIETDLDSSLSLARLAYQQAASGKDEVSLQSASLCVIAALIESYKFSEARLRMSTLKPQLHPGSEEYSELLFWKCKMALKKPNYPKAIQLGHMGLQHLEQAGDKPIELKSKYLGLMGLAYTTQGLFDSSEYFFGQQLALLEEQGLSKAAAFLDYASYMLAREEIPRAIEYCLKAIEASNRSSLIYQKAKGLKIALDYSVVMSDSLASNEAKRTTLLYCRNTSVALVAEFHRRGWHKNAAISQDMVAKTYWVLGQLDSATAHYQKAQRSFALVGDTARMAAVQIHLGQVYESQKMWDTAAMYFVEAHRLAKKASVWLTAGDAAYNASLMYEQMDSMLTSLNWLHEKLWIQNEKVFNQEREKAVQKYRALYEAEESDRKAQEAINEKQILQNQRNLILAISIALSIVLIASILLLRSYSKSLKNKKRIHELETEELLRKNDMQREGARLEGQDTERKKIARDLHDELGGTLSMIQMHLSGISDKVEGFKEQEKQQYQQANHLLERALEQVKNISRDMMSGTLSKFGLMAAFHDLADIVNTSRELNFKLVGKAPKRSLESAAELGIFRVVQELTSNSLKHSKASEIRLELIEHADELGITYEDNGIGFDAKAAKGSPGIGIRNIYSRLAQMNGTLNLETAPGKGVLYIMEIPFDTNDKSSTG